MVNIEILFGVTGLALFLPLTYFTIKVIDNLQRFDVEQKHPRFEHLEKLFGPLAGAFLLAGILQGLDTFGPYSNLRYIGATLAILTVLLLTYQAARATRPSASQHTRGGVRGE